MPRSTNPRPLRGLHAARRRALSAIAALVALPVVARADDDESIVLGTSTPGGGFARYGETVARIVDARAGRRLVVARPTRGTTENLRRLADGTLDAALIQGTAASELFDGPDTGIRILFAMYPSPGMLAVPAASPATRLEDLRGRPVVFGVRTSGLVTLARQVFDGIGLDLDRDFAAIYVDEAATSPRLVVDGHAEALWGAGEGWPGFETLAGSPGGARFIGPQPAQIAAIVARWPLLQPMTVAPGSYRGIDRPLATVGSVNWILARPGLDDARAAAFVDAMDHAAADLAAALPQAAFSTLANTRAAAPSPRWLHRAIATL